MEIEVAITKHLLAYAGLTALVGTRVYQHGSVPENATCPYVSMFLVSGSDEQCLAENPSYYEDTFQFTSAGATRESANNVAKQVKAALKGYSGVMGGTGGVTVQTVLQDGKKDAIEKRTDGKTIFYRDEDFEFHYEG